MKKVLSISLALLVLFANSGFTVATHFCGGNPVSSKVMIGNHHIDCGMDSMDASLCDVKSEQPLITESNCCDNEYLSIEESNYNESSKIQLPALHFTFAFIHSYYTCIPLLAKNTNTSFLIPIPPLLKQDIQILFQNFLI